MLKVSEVVSRRAAFVLLVVTSWTASADVGAQTLREAIETAIIEGPSLQEAASNRDAVAQELRQADGRYLPTVDVNLQGGPRYLREDERTGSSDSSSTFTSRSANLALTQLLYDGQETDGEIDRQSFRLSSANYRLLDRQQDEDIE